MPKPPFNPNLPEDQQKALLNQNYTDRIKNDIKLYDKTMAAQKSRMDKFMLAIYSSYRYSAGAALSNEQKYELGIGANNANQNAEREHDKKVTENALSAILKPPSLETYRELYFMVGLTKAWGAQQIGKDNADCVKRAEKILQANPPVGENEESKIDGRDLKQQLGDLLSFKSEGPAHKIPYGAESEILGAMKERIVPGSKTRDNPDGKDHNAHMRELLKQELLSHLQPRENPAMTFQQYMELVKMDDASKREFLRMMNAQPGDNIYNKFFEITEQGLDPGTRRTLARPSVIAQTEANEKRAAFNELDPTDPAYPEKDEMLRQADERAAAAKRKYRADLFEDTLETMTTTFVKDMQARWTKEGEAAYEKGLQETEKKDLQNGRRILAMNSSKIGNNLSKHGIHHNQYTSQYSNENTVKMIKSADEALRSGKPLNVLRQPGYTEAVYADNPKAYDERAYLTGGVLTQLRSIPSKWKRHSEDSSTYKKFLSTLRNYHNALRSKEGGLVNAARIEFIQACKDYVKGKESLRSHHNGQQRFDLAMTMLQKELKADAFQAMIDKINKKRDNAHQVSVEGYQGKVNYAVKLGKEQERGAHNKGLEDATRLSYASGSVVFLMDEKYGYPNPVEGELPFAPIGMQKNKKYHLNPKEYSAVVFASSLSSSKREIQLLPEDLPALNDEAVAEGRKVAEAAFRAYGGEDGKADKIPLAKLLTLGIRKISEEMSGRDAKDQECMKEMSARMANMLNRDPELKKLALRQGLREEEIPKVPKKDAEAEQDQPVLQQDLNVRL